ncbi:MAG: hypothetical protein FWE02_01730 [Defluviitaleaceae bacterium]|nr:hypothetical protein [Defluviitaleaceae bacterium]
MITTAPMITPVMALTKSVEILATIIDTVIDPAIINSVGINHFGLMACFFDCSIDFPSFM